MKKATFKVCDGVIDCPDGSDEGNNCPRSETQNGSDEDDKERKEAFLGYLKHLEDTNLTMTTKNIVQNRSRMKRIILEILSELDPEPPVSSTIPSNLPIIRGTTEHSRALRPVQVCLSKFNLDFIPSLVTVHPDRIRISKNNLDNC